MILYRFTNAKNRFLYVVNKVMLMEQKKEFRTQPQEHSAHMLELSCSSSYLKASDWVHFGFNNLLGLHILHKHFTKDLSITQKTIVILIKQMKS